MAVMPVGQSPDPFDRQPGESAKAYRAFCVYRDMPTDERSLAKTAAKVHKSLTWMTTWSGRYAWISRAASWDLEMDRVARAARLAEIARINTEDVQIADEMLRQARRHMARAAAALDKSPHALSEWVKTAVTTRRTALGLDERRVVVAGDPEQPVVTEVRSLMATLPPELVLDAQQLAIKIALARNRSQLGLPAAPLAIGGGAEDGPEQ